VAALSFDRRRSAYINVLPVDIAHKHQVAHALEVVCFPEIDSKVDLIERRILAAHRAIEGARRDTRAPPWQAQLEQSARAGAAPIQAMAYDARPGQAPLIPQSF
jgi:hypothetical protein